MEYIVIGNAGGNTLNNILNTKYSCYWELREANTLNMNNHVYNIVFKQTHMYIYMDTSGV